MRARYATLKLCTAVLLCMVAGFVGAGITFTLVNQQRNPYDVVSDFQGLIAALVAFSGATLALIAAQARVRSEEALEQRKKDALAHAMRMQVRELTFQAFGIGRRLDASSRDLAANLASVTGFCRILDDWSRRADELVSHYRDHCHELRPADIDLLSNLMVRFGGLIFDIKIASMMISMFPQAQPGERLERSVRYIGAFVQVNATNVATEYPGAIEEWTNHFQQVDNLREQARNHFGF